MLGTGNDDIESGAVYLTKDDIGSPGDVFKRWREEVCEGKVEDLARVSRS